MSILILGYYGEKRLSLTTVDNSSYEIIVYQKKGFAVATISSTNKRKKSS
jgi:hypothetical protein